MSEQNKKGLLIVTQKVDLNDPVLGFFHAWLKAFSVHYEQVTVICLEKGMHNLPNNVQVYSLGKEEFLHTDKISNVKKRLIYSGRFLRYIIELRNKYNVVFVHMNIEYVAIGGLVWRLLQKKVLVWYAHSRVSNLLRIAVMFAHAVVTSVPSGFKIKSKKVRVIGQGIDTDLFIPDLLNTKLNSKPKSISDNTQTRIISVGRIAPVKNYETLIDAVYELKNHGYSVKTTIVGDIVMQDDKKYYDMITQKIKDRRLVKEVELVGSMPNTEVVSVLQNSDIFVNTCNSGLDKAMLEALSCGVPVMSCNPGLEKTLGLYKDELMYKERNDRELTTKLIQFINMHPNKRSEMSVYLRDAVINNHNLRSFVKKIVFIADQL